ncbi:unnamed protein product, partial [Laminaria digitata]
ACTRRCVLGCLTPSTAARSSSCNLSSLSCRWVLEGPTLCYRSFLVNLRAHAVGCSNYGCTRVLTYLLPCRLRISSYEWYDAAVSSTTVPAGALLIAGTVL